MDSRLRVYFRYTDITCYIYFEWSVESDKLRKKSISNSNVLNSKTFFLIKKKYYFKYYLDWCDRSIVGNKENAHFYAFSERLVMIIDLRSIQITICLIKRVELEKPWYNDESLTEWFYWSNCI